MKNTFKKITIFSLCFLAFTLCVWIIFDDLSDVSGKVLLSSIGFCLCSFPCILFADLYDSKFIKFASFALALALVTLTLYLLLVWEVPIIAEIDTLQNIFYSLASTLAITSVVAWILRYKSSGKYFNIFLKTALVLALLLALANIFLIFTQDSEGIDTLISIVMRFDAVFRVLFYCCVICLTILRGK